MADTIEPEFFPFIPDGSTVKLKTPMVAYGQPCSVGIVTGKFIDNRRELYQVKFNDSGVWSSVHFDEIEVIEMAEIPKPKVVGRVLIYIGEHTDKLVFQVTGADSLDAAYLALFRHFDANEFYTEIDDSVSLIAARNGDAKAAEKLLKRRRDFENEDWSLVDLIDPRSM